MSAFASYLGWNGNSALNAPAPLASAQLAAPAQLVAAAGEVSLVKAKKKKKKRNKKRNKKRGMRRANKPAPAVRRSLERAHASYLVRGAVRAHADHVEVLVVVHSRDGLARSFERYLRPGAGVRPRGFSVAAKGRSREALCRALADRRLVRLGRRRDDELSHARARREHAVISRAVAPPGRHQGREPRQQLARGEQDVGRAVTPLSLQRGQLLGEAP